MIHRKVQIIVFSDSTKDREVLLFQTNEKRGGFWQNITGSVEKEDQSLEDAAKRELLEESGLKSEVIKKLNPVLQFVDRYQRNVEEHVFYCLVKKTKPNLSKEHQAYQWCKITQVTKDSYGHLNNYEMFQEALGRLT